jgi:4-amino-4-deoxy-L-arabinose transferase-like glycosyltransferase
VDDNYYDIAHGIVAGEGYQLDGAPTAYRLPVYPIILAGCLEVFGPGQLAPQVLQYVMGVGLILATYWLAKTYNRPEAGLIAAALFSLGGGLPTFTVALGSDLPFLLLSFCLYVVLLRGKNLRAMALAGVLLGVALLTRGVLVSTIPLLLFWLWRHQLARLKAIAVFGITCGMVLTPWIIRNAVVFGRFVPLSSGLGPVLWGVHNPVTYEERPGGWLPTSTLPYADEFQTLDEFERDSRMRELAWQEITHRPIWRTANLIRAKFTNYFLFSNGLHINRPISSALSIAAFSSSFILGCGYILWRRLPEGICEWFADRRNQAMAELIGFAVLGQLINTFVFYGNGRFRLAIEPFLAIVLATAITLTVQKPAWRKCSLVATQEGM